MQYVTRYAGDDWKIPFRFQDVAHTPISIVGWSVEGAILAAFSVTPIPLSAFRGSVVITDAPNGSGLFLISSDITKDVPTEKTGNDGEPALPNRLQIKLLDGSGKIHTMAVLSIKVLKP